MRKRYYPNPVLQHQLETQAIKMVGNSKLMEYVKERFPKMAKNLQSIARSRDLSLDIDR